VSPDARRPGPRRASAWRNALSLFTIIPVRASTEFGPGDAARAVLWLPGAGLLLGLIGGGVLDFVYGMGSSGGPADGMRRLLGAVLAVAIIALLTGALHLDGLADTADGLGSRQPAAAALAIMRKSDIGPMGVAALVLALLIQVAALASVPPASAGPAGSVTGTAGLAFVLAAVTGRVSVVLATGSPAARPGGFGALVAGQTSVLARALSIVLLTAAVLAAGLAIGGAGLAARGVAAAGTGLLAGTAMRFIAVRRLGGTTGDVFGAVLEVSATAVLLACALGG
jgi:adenosylcobinamide-GDP ribazoletransferase